MSVLIITDHREIVGGEPLPTAAQSVVNYAWRSAKLHFTIDIELGLTIRRLLPAALLYCHHLLNYLIVSQSEVASVLDGARTFRKQSPAEVTEVRLHASEKLAHDPGLQYTRSYNRLACIC